MRRFVFLGVCPVLALLVAAVWPLISGDGTLYLRDVLSSHYPLKASQASALRQGLPWVDVPLVDVHRAGGQPLLGNPNSLPLYPDNALYLVAPALWALNAHFWIHLLLTPFAFYWLARAWGLTRPAAWAAGTLYATSGFVLSLLNFYNLVAGAALAPAFAAACLDAWSPAPQRRRRLSLVSVALLWALLLLAGDPLFAALALVLALTAGLMRARHLPAQPHRFLFSLGLGTALAAPMLVEFLRILPLSYRGYQSFSPSTIWLQSWDPRLLVEWLLPLFFGPPDLSFWGQRFSDGLPPLFYSLAPGALALGLVYVRGRSSRRVDIWAWCLVLGGLFLALGKHNPLLLLAEGLPGVAVLRFPVKAWLAVAMGLALLGGLGAERLFSTNTGRRRLGRALAALAAVQIGLWTVFSFAADDGFWASALRSFDPHRLAGSALDAQRLRWAGIAILSTLVLAGLRLALALTRRRPAAGLALLLAVQTAGQLVLLRPLYDSDDTTPYRSSPEILDTVLAAAPNGRIVHGGVNDLFGAGVPGRLPNMPDARTKWLSRGHYQELYPFAGVPHGLRYEFNPSPEGLGSFFTIALGRAIKGLPDEARLRLLAASGVEVLLLDRPLAPDALPLVRLLDQRPSLGHTLHIYQLQRPAPPTVIASTVARAPQMNDALRVLTAPGFDPWTMTVLPGNPGDHGGEDKGSKGPRVERYGGGNSRILRESAEEIVVEVDGSGGVLVVQRAYLGIWRATLDGADAEVLPASFHRLGVEVPAGNHTVRLYVDRGPTHVAWIAALLALGGLTWLMWLTTRAVSDTKQ